MPKKNAYKIQESILDESKNPPALLPLKDVYYNLDDIVFINETPEDKIIQLIGDSLYIALEKYKHEYYLAEEDWGNPLKTKREVYDKMYLYGSKIEAINSILNGFMNGLLHFDCYKKVYDKDTFTAKLKKAVKKTKKKKKERQ